jgi:hypothetical protein
MGRHRITNWVIKNAVGAYDAIVGASGTITTDKVPVGQADGTVIWDDPPGGAGGAPDDAKYIVQEAHADLSAEQSLGALTTGILKNTVTAGVGVLSIAAAADLPALDLADLADVDTTGVADGDALIYDSGTSEWVAGTIATAAFKGAIVRRTTNQSIGDNSVTAITFDAEDKDTDGFWTVGSPTRFTIPEDGVYIFGGGVTFASNTTGKRAIYVRRGGTDYLAMQEVGSTTSDSRRLAVAGMEEFTASQYIELYVYQNSTGSLNATPETEASIRFWIAKLEPGLSLAGGSSGGDTGDATTYVATTGNDTTGDGTSGAPYATVAKALSTLPRSINYTQTIDVANGTYAEPIDLQGFVCTGKGLIKFVGDTTTPANVTFTGTVTVGSSTYGVVAVGPVNFELEGIRVNVTSTNGVGALYDAFGTIDRCTVTGAHSTASILVTRGAHVVLQGNNTLSGFVQFGILATRSGDINFNSAGTLTITGPGTTGEGIHLSHGSRFICETASTPITITGVLRGFQLGLCAQFQHIGSSSTITIDNASKPASSSAIQTTDCSTWSTNNTLVIDNFTVDFEENSNSYIEAVGTRTITNVTSNTANGTAVQGGFVYLP